MSSMIGNKIKLSIFGQSHSEAIGAVIDGIPAGITPDIDFIKQFMARRAPSSSEFSTKRKEADEFEIVSGLSPNGQTCGAPICAIIKNTNTRSQDYKNIKMVPRPSHSDFCAFTKYGESHDIAGGGHFSGRLTAPLCFAGALAMQLLKEKGIHIFSRIHSIAGIKDDEIDMAKVGFKELETISSHQFPVINEEKGALMLDAIRQARLDGDSVGGVIECFAINVPAGVGDPMFDGLENSISKAVFGVPAVKGIEFGAGFESSLLKGSQNNDEFYIENGNIKTKTNNHGGILGGISTGMPIVFKAAIKPTASIAKAQNTVDMINKTNTVLEIKGRHDSCIVPRAMPGIESALALVLADYMI